MELHVGRPGRAAIDRSHSVIVCSAARRTLQSQAENIGSGQHTCAQADARNSLFLLTFLDLSMASAESLKILRSLQSRPENKVRDLMLCKHPAKALLGEQS